MNDIIMETERLIIRRFKAEDWQDLYDYLSKEEVVRYEPYGIYTEEESKKEAARRADDEAFFAVELKENHKVIGNTSFATEGHEQFLTWEIGYVLNPDYQGKGYATEASRRILKYGFEELNAHRIMARCNPVNKKSWHLMERLKMRREGHFINNAFHSTEENGRPIWHDAYEYAILSKEFKCN